MAGWINDLDSPRGLVPTDFVRRWGSKDDRGLRCRNGAVKVGLHVPC